MFGRTRRAGCAGWKRGLAICSVLVAAALMPGTSETAAAQEASDLQVRRAVVRLARTADGERVAKRVVLRGYLDTFGPASEFDLATDDVRVTLNGAQVFALAHGDDRSGVSEVHFGCFKFREQGVPRRRASRLVLDLRRGKFKLDARGLALETSVLGEPTDADVVIELCDRRLETAVDFVEKRRQWRLRAPRRPAIAPPGGGNPGDGGPGTVPPGEPMPFTIVDSGTMSGITTRREVVIRDAGAWAALWAEHRGGSAPSVDFTRELVVGVFQGNQPTAGYGASLTGVVATDGDYDVRHEFSSPWEVCAGATVITQPFVLARVRTTCGLVGFTESRGIRLCHFGL